MGQRLSQRRTWDLRRVTELVFQEEVPKLEVHIRSTIAAIASYSSSCVPACWAAAAARVSWQTWWMEKRHLRKDLVVPQDLEYAIQEAIVLPTLAQAPVC